MKPLGMRTQGTRCPACGDWLDGTMMVTGDKSRAPKSGDLSVCVSCGALSQFNDALGLVRIRDLPANADARTTKIARLAQALVLAKRGKISS